jgi:CheY-like chemotaxis protein
LLATITPNFRQIASSTALSRFPLVREPFLAYGRTTMDTTVSAERRGSILLVEDEPLICDIATEALVEQGFDVQAVATASEALICLNSGRRIDVLFTDVNLPGDMDGATLAQRARELRPDLPVMYTSGKRASIEQLNPVDGSMFVPKPYNPFSIGPLLEYLVSVRKIASLQVPARA